MAATFQTDGGGALYAEQWSGSFLDYTLDWSDALEDGDSIAQSEWTHEPGIIVARKSFTDTGATSWISGGLAGVSYLVRNTITTGTGRQDSRSFRVFVRAAEALGAGLPASIFPSLPAAVASLRRDRLAGPAQLWLAGVELSDEYLLDKLLVAERHAERRLRLFLTPREMVAEDAPEEEVAALEAAGHRVEREPGYDFEPGGLGGDNWTAISLRHPPVLAIHSCEFRFAGGFTYLVPPAWFRLDSKVGRLQLVPTGVQALLQMGGQALSVIGGGRTWPLGVRIRYRSGLANARRDHPDLLDLIAKIAVLDVLDDQFMPSSGSISADGLSQTQQWDSGKHRAAIDARLDAIRQSMRGLRLAVL